MLKSLTYTESKSSLLKGRVFIIGVIFGVAIGSTALYLVFANFPDLANYALGSDEGSDDTPTQLPSKGIDDQKPTLITNDLKYTLLDVRESEFGVNGEKPLQGGIFVITKLEIENIGKTELSVYGSSWYVEDSQGRMFKPKTFDAQLKDEKTLFRIQIPPGFQVIHDIGFEIPDELPMPLQLYVPDEPFEAEPILLDQIS